MSLENDVDLPQNDDEAVDKGPGMESHESDKMEDDVTQANDASAEGGEVAAVEEMQQEAEDPDLEDGELEDDDDDDAAVDTAPVAQAESNAADDVEGDGDKDKRTHKRHHKDRHRHGDKRRKHRPNKDGKGRDDDGTVSGEEEAGGRRERRHDRRRKHGRQKSRRDRRGEGDVTGAPEDGAWFGEGQDGGYQSPPGPYDSPYESPDVNGDPYGNESPKGPYDTPSEDEYGPPPNKMAKGFNDGDEREDGEEAGDVRRDRKDRRPRREKERDRWWERDRRRDQGRSGRGGRKNDRDGGDRRGGGRDERGGGRRDDRGRQSRWDEAPRGGGGGNQRGQCKFFMEGQCKKGDDCPFFHEVGSAGDGPRRPQRDLCKFYTMSEGCHRDHCKYMHEDYPCKFFHMNRPCFKGANCLFSHGKLNEEQQAIIDWLRWEETDSDRQRRGKKAGLLGDQPRNLEAELQRVKNIPSLFDIETKPPTQAREESKNDDVAEEDEVERKEDEIEEPPQNERVGSNNDNWGAPPGPPMFGPPWNRPPPPIGGPPMQMPPWRAPWMGRPPPPINTQPPFSSWQPTPAATADDDGPPVLEREETGLAAAPTKEELPADLAPKTRELMMRIQSNQRDVTPDNDMPVLTALNDSFKYSSEEEEVEKKDAVGVTSQGGDSSSLQNILSQISVAAKQTTPMAPRAAPTPPVMPTAARGMLPPPGVVIPTLGGAAQPSLLGPPPGYGGPPVPPVPPVWNPSQPPPTRPKPPLLPQPPPQPPTMPQPPALPQPPSLAPQPAAQQSKESDLQRILELLRQSGAASTITTTAQETASPDAGSRTSAPARSTSDPRMRSSDPRRLRPDVPAVADSPPQLEPIMPIKSNRPIVYQLHSITLTAEHRPSVPERVLRRPPHHHDPRVLIRTQRDTFVRRGRRKSEAEQQEQPELPALLRATDPPPELPALLRADSAPGRNSPPKMNIHESLNLPPVASNAPEPPSPVSTSPFSHRNDPRFRKKARMADLPLPGDKSGESSSDELKGVEFEQTRRNPLLPFNPALSNKRDKPAALPRITSAYDQKPTPANKRRDVIAPPRVTELQDEELAAANERTPPYDPDSAGGLADFDPPKGVALNTPAADDDDSLQIDLAEQEEPANVKEIFQTLDPTASPFC